MLNFSQIKGKFDKENHWLSLLFGVVSISEVLKILLLKGSFIKETIGVFYYFDE